MRAQAAIARTGAHNVTADALNRPEETPSRQYLCYIGRFSIHLASLVKPSRFPQRSYLLRLHLNFWETYH